MTATLNKTADPLAFGRVVLGRRRWSGQRKMRHAMRDHRRVRFQSGNATGKTHELAGDIIEFIATGQKRRVVCTGPSFAQVQRGLWAEIRNAWHDAARRGVKIGQEPGAESWEIGPGHGAFIASVDNISSIQGGRGAGGTWIAMDEAQGVHDAQLWTALESLMQDPRSRFFTSCNPLYPEGVDYENSLSAEWHTVTLDSLAHPNVVTGREIIPGAVSRLWVEECRKRWGEDDPRWIARVLGRYPEVGMTSLFSMRTIENAAMVKPTLTEGLHIGIDVAGEGGDLNVATIVRDGVVEAVREWSGVDPMGTAGIIIRLIRETAVNPQNVHIDATGLGSGIVNRIREQGFDVEGVVFSASPTGQWADILHDQHAENRRVEMYLVAAQLLRDCQLNIPAKFELTRRDLCATGLIAPSSSGASRLEKKDAIKKKIGRSPDFGDSLVLALSRNGSTEFCAWV